VELIELGDLSLEYTSLEAVRYTAGAQFYGVMEGRLEGARLSGAVHLTNVAQGRPDGVNTPTLRGLLTTGDGTLVWLEMDGLATLRTEDGARVFVTSCRLRAAEGPYAWVDTVVGVVEGVLDPETGAARARVYECRPTIT
jgi:hypothetical protein